MGGDQFGWIPEILFEAQLKGLTDGADDILSEPFRALQDMAGWGTVEGPVSSEGGWAGAPHPQPPEDSPIKDNW